VGDSWVDPYIPEVKQKTFDYFLLKKKIGKAKCRTCGTGKLVRWKWASMANGGKQPVSDRFSAGKLTLLAPA
jgi:hypothetical protein